MTNQQAEIQETSGQAGRILRPRRAVVDETGRDGALRRVRRTSHWSAVAIVLGVGATTVGLAHELNPTTQATTAVGGSSSSALPATPSAGSSTAPKLGSPVATTSASGVTTVVGSTRSGSATAVSQSGTARGDS